MTELTRSAVSELALRDDQTEWTDKQRYALGLGDNVTNADLAIYFHVCKRTGLDPFARQIYMLERWTKDGPRQTIQVGIDGFRLIATRAAGERGYGEEDTVWCGDDGVWRDVWTQEGPPAAARFVVIYKGQRHPAVALYNEYVQTLKSGDPNAMWKRMPANQLAKCAEALALRKTFPQDLSGLYTDDEMGQARNAERHETPPTMPPDAAPTSAAFRSHNMPETITVEPTTYTATLPIEDIQEGEVIHDGIMDPVETGEQITPGQRRKMFALFGEAGFETDARTDEGRSLRLAYIANVIGQPVESTNDLTTAQATAVIEALIADAEARTAAEQ